MITFLRRSFFLLTLLLVLAGPLLSCQRQTETDQTNVTVTPSAPASESSQTQPDETRLTETTASPEQPTPVPQPKLIELADAGRLESGHTLHLSGGKWYDASQQNQLDQISELAVEASGTGRPTISLTEETAPVLTISGSDNITFENIRFGYQRADYQVGAAVSEISLLKISNSRNIHFVNCEFFGSAGTAIVLANVQNIRFTGCQFYNNAGLPLQTDLTAAPSQASFIDCSFETIDSGLMPLNLSRSTFDDCSFIGHDGYRVPIPAASCPISAGQNSALYQQLEGILAGRVSYFRDDGNMLTMRQSLFCSVDLYVLYEDLLQTVKQVLPQGWYNMALAGEKDGEQELGRPLKPNLDLQIDLRTQTDEGFYDLDQMIQDLQPLAQLPDLLEQLPDGQIRVRLFDQNNLPLLSGEVAIDQLETLLQQNDPARWLSESQWLLWQPHLSAAEFSGLSLGRITPAIATLVLKNAWQQKNEPLLIEEDSGSGQYVMLQPRLTFDGTQLNQKNAVHYYQLSIERNARAGDCMIVMPVADIAYQAGNGTKIDHFQGQNQKFTLPDNQLRLLLAPLLSEILPLTPDADQIAASPFPELIAGESIQLSLLAPDGEIAWAASPVLIYQKSEQLISLKTVLYDQAVRPWLVRLELSKLVEAIDVENEVRWQIEKAELIAG